MKLVVIAKEPRPGFVKTRLCPPCTPEQAASIARAALADTLDAVRATPADTHVLALDGTPGDWLPEGFDVIAQRGDGLGERLAAVFADVGASPGSPTLVIGMDTPQVTPALLTRARSCLNTNHGAVLGPAYDGGYWVIGLDRNDRGAFTGVPMGEPDTCARQRAQLEARGFSVAISDTLRDIDTAVDARAVAAEIPASRFAAAVRTQLGPHVADRS